MKNKLKLKIILIILAVSIAGCKQNDDDRLSDEQISLNLLEIEGGDVDPELLIGEWDLITFAYTADGKEISNEVAISKFWGITEKMESISFHGYLLIPSAPSKEMTDEYMWYVHHENSVSYICSISDNLINLRSYLATTKGVMPPSEWYDVCYAFDNVYSFVIKDDKLIIYFRRLRDKEKLSKCKLIEGKNILILKKREL